MIVLINVNKKIIEIIMFIIFVGIVILGVVFLISRCLVNLFVELIEFII